MDEGLIRRFHDLPPELFEQIREEVLRYDPPSTNLNGYYFIHTTSEYRLPSILQIDRSSRARLSPDYLYCRVFRFSSVDLFRRFINAICDTQFRLAAGFQAWYYPEENPGARTELETFINQVHERAHKCGTYMLAHNEPVVGATVDGSPSNGTKQNAFVVWNQQAAPPKISHDEVDSDDDSIFRGLTQGDAGTA